jgi:hypothetical protein
MVERLVEGILNFFRVNDIDEYMVVGENAYYLRNIANQVDGQMIGGYKLHANGRVCYDSERNKFTTKIERDKL